MKKIYHFINDEDSIEIVYSSEDRSLIEECICDSFMEDLAYEFDDCLDFMKPAEAAKDAWDRTLDWYNMYVYIGESRFI